MLRAGRVIVAGALLLPACSSAHGSPDGRGTKGASPTPTVSGTASVPVRANGAFVRGCGTEVVGELGNHPERYALVLGPLMLIPLPGYANAPASQFRPRHGSERQQKVLAVVRSTVRLAIAPSDRDHASLLYDPTKWDRRRIHISDGEPVVEFVPCRPLEDRFGTQFNGAFLVHGPRCVKLVASWAEGRRRVVEAPFGVRSCRTRA